VAENVSLVLDGVSIVPGLIDLRAYAKLAHVFFLVVSTLDDEAFRSRFTSRAVGAQRRPARRYLDHLEDILRIQDHILDLADRHAVPIVDNISFDRSVLFIIRHVTEALRKLEDFDAEALR
jgi:2-phosphoglycerate kinase